MNPYLIAAIISLVLVLVAAFTNVRKIRRGEVDPALSTWLMSLVATVLSLATYLATETNDVISGVLNVADVLAIAIVTGSIIFFTKRGWRFKRFERLYYCR